jgi:hypothetical protein
MKHPLIRGLRRRLRSSLPVNIRKAAIGDPAPKLIVFVEERQLFPAVLPRDGRI